MIITSQRMVTSGPNSVVEGTFIKQQLLLMGTMEVPESKTIEKLRRLQDELRNECMEDDVAEIGDFTIMFDSENGRNVYFVKDMPIERTQSMRESYDKNSPYFSSKYGDIGWPYTGFVQGNIAGWNPISAERLAEWIDQSPVYTIEEFVEKFRHRRTARS
jgi:hypothetical protein